MNHKRVKAFAGTTLAALLLSQMGQAVFACPQHHQQAIPTNKSHRTETQNCSVATAMSIESAEKCESQVQSKITSLDQSIRESLGKITKIENDEFKSQQNEPYKAALSAEQQNLQAAEKELSRALKEEENLKQLIGAAPSVTR